MAERDILVLFDVDGTLTPSRLVIKPEMKEFILKLKEKVVIGESLLCKHDLQILVSIPAGNLELQGYLKFDVAYG